MLAIDHTPVWIGVHRGWGRCWVGNGCWMTAVAKPRLLVKLYGLVLMQQLSSDVFFLALTFHSPHRSLIQKVTTA